MGRKIVFFLAVGTVIGTLSGLAAAEERISPENRLAFSAVGGVADYWADDNPADMTQERGPAETGALPEMSDESGNEAPAVGSDDAIDRVEPNDAQ